MTTTTDREVVRYHVNQLRSEVTSLRIHLERVRARAEEAITALDEGRPLPYGTVLGQAAGDVETRAARLAALLDVLPTIGATDADMEAALAGQRVSR